MKSRFFFAGVTLAATLGSPLAAQTPDVPVAPAAVNSPAARADSAAPAAAGSLVVTSAAAARFDGAMNSFNAGQYGDAVTAFSDFVRDFPEDRRRDEALYRLAESYRNLGRSDDALAAYAFEVQAYPNSVLRVNAELRRGAILFDAGKFEDAIPALRLVVEKGDVDLQEPAKYLLGRAYLATQKEPDARGMLQPLADENPAGKYSGAAAETLAELDDSRDDHASAFPLWRKAVAASTDPAAQARDAARGGWSALESKQPAEAEKLFVLARKLDANGEPRRVATTGLLRLLFAQKRYREWVSVYGADKDRLLDSARAELLYDLGQAQFSLKHWPEAVAGFDQYIQAFPTDKNVVGAAYERFLAVTQIDRTRTAVEAEMYLKTWPQSPFRARVHLLEAQEFSREKTFADALPLWKELAAEPAAPDWPHQEILLELGRSYDELGDFATAATTYQAYLDDVTAHPLAAGQDHAALDRQVLQTQARLAICLEKSNQLLAATEAWKAVQALAPDGSREQEAALESLGLIYAKGGPAQEGAMVETFRTLLARFPQSPLRALAAFSVGDSFFRNRDYANAEPLLLQARDEDSKTWQQPATQRLVLGAYGEKNEAKTISYVQQYDVLPLPANPQAQVAARLPAALFYWLAQNAQKAGALDQAEAWYARVTQHPEAGDLLAGAFWQLGTVQSQRKEWPAAVASYEKYRQLKPDTKDATVVLLALGKAELGAQDTDAAKKLGDQSLLQEPEGPRSAAARMLLGETAFAAGNYAEAARMFGTLAVLFDDPVLTPRAIARAADSYDKAGDGKSATDWRAKLQKYPGFQRTPYL